MSHGMGSGNHAEVDELRAKVAELLGQLAIMSTMATDAELSAANFKAAHAVEEKLRRWAELERYGAQLARNSMMDEADAMRVKCEELTGYVRRLRAALIAHTPPMFMREVEALLESTKNV